MCDDLGLGARVEVSEARVEAAGQGLQRGAAVEGALGRDDVARRPGRAGFSCLKLNHYDPFCYYPSSTAKPISSNTLLATSITVFACDGSTPRIVKSL